MTLNKMIVTQDGFTQNDCQYNDCTKYGHTQNDYTRLLYIK